MAQRPTSPALLRLSPVELGRILAFLRPCDLYLTATSVCKALSTAATEAWELWPAVAAADTAVLQARARNMDRVLRLCSDGSDVAVRSVHEWQWRRVLIGRALFHQQCTQRQHWHRVSERAVATFIATGPQKSLRRNVLDILDLRSRSALFGLMPCSVGGRRDAVCGAIRQPMLEGLAGRRSSFSVPLYFLGCSLAALGAFSEMMLALQKSRVCTWVIAAEIAGLESFFHFISPWVEPFVGELPSADIVQALVGDRAWRTDKFERVAGFFGNTVPLTTLRGLTPIQKELFLSLHGIVDQAAMSTGAQSLLDARDGASTSWRSTLFGTPGASALVKAALVAGLAAGVVTALCRRWRSPITSQSRLYRPSTEVPQHQGTLRGRLVSIARRWREPLILTLDTLWLRFAFATGAALGDHINSLFVLHAIAVLDDVLSRCSWTPSAKTTLATILIVSGIVSGRSLWSQGRRALTKIILSRSSRRIRGQATAPQPAAPSMFSESTRSRLLLAFQATACLCAAAAALRVYDAAGLQRFGYRVLAAVSASAHGMGPLPPIETIINVTSTHDRADGLGPFANASLPYAEHKQYINRTALTAFVASRPLLIPLRGVLVGVGSFLIGQATTVLKQDSAMHVTPQRRYLSKKPHNTQRTIAAVARVVREAVRRVSGFLPHVVVGAAAAYVAAVESNAALRCEMYLSNVIFGALVFAVGTTIGDTAVGLL